jgi:predicted DNA-binding protein
MTTTTKVQLPIRISQAQHQRFVAISQATKIPMSTLARDALERHLSNIETNGIEAVLKQAVISSRHEARGAYHMLK